VCPKACMPGPLAGACYARDAARPVAGVYPQSGMVLPVLPTTGYRGIDIIISPCTMFIELLLSVVAPLPYSPQFATSMILIP